VIALLPAIHPTQRELEARCDQVLDQILAWPEVNVADLPGAPLGEATHRVNGWLPEPYGDPLIHPGVRPWTPEEVTAWYLGVDQR